MVEFVLEKIKENEKKITMSLLIIYLLVIAWIILFKMAFSFQELPNFRNINLIPLAGSVIVNNKIYFSEIINNILIFVPFGLYISMLKSDWSFFKKVTLVAGVSLLFEVIQFIFAIGGTDITDLIGNTIGGVIGIGIYLVVCRLLKVKTNKVLNILASIGTIFIVALLGLIVVVNS